MSSPDDRLPPIWKAAFERERGFAKPALADPLPERRLSRLLAAFIASGLLFMVLPGTLIGVWNLLSISAQRESTSAPAAWIQAHGHAQLFGWVGTFIFGISIYAVPKFRGAWIRSLPLAWAAFALWVFGVTLRWCAGITGQHAPWGLPAAALAELAAVLLIIYEITPRSASKRQQGAWNTLIFSGFAGLAVLLAFQLVVVLRIEGAIVPAEANHILLNMALWAFCVPVVMGFSAKFLPSLLALRRASDQAAYGGLALIVIALAGSLAGFEKLSSGLILAAVLLLAHWLGVFHRSTGRAKTIGMDARYPLFARGAFVWLVVSAILGIWAEKPGILGASRHAFTVGFLAALIFSIGPRILPTFLNSRELWSKRLVFWALLLLSAGCAIRVTTEPLAYAGVAGYAWNLLPVSAVLELTAVLLFASNMAVTLLRPMPAWMDLKLVTAELKVYWLVSSYPDTRRILTDAGLETIGRAPAIPRTLTLAEAAEADGVQAENAVHLLKAYFESRLAKAARANQSARKALSGESLQCGSGRGADHAVRG
ncbi:MAG: NnrS family protein [Bryobacterales bacterium]|nr:NnrS family protein [Bryobacterales bacterium]